MQRKTTMKEDSWISYLSESYENLTGEPNLELKVITLNINEGHNSRLMEQCQILREYAQYVAKVRETAVALQEAEFSMDKIAEVLQIDKEIVEKWLKELPDNFFEKSGTK